MISRAEYLYTKSKMEKLSQVLFNFEMNSSTYKEWMTWINGGAGLDGKTLSMRAKSIQEWNEYYKQAAEGYYGKAFFGLKKDFVDLIGSTDDKAKEDKITALRAKIKEMDESNIPYLRKPTSIEPTSFYQDPKLLEYINLKEKYLTMKQLVEEYQPVYESKKGDDSI